MEGIELIAIGAGLPVKQVHNDAFAERMDTSDEWIYTRTGIHSRRFCSGEESMLSISIQAAAQALEKSGLVPEQIGCVIVATVSPDYVTPSASCLIQAELGLRENIPVMDINAACAGFLYGLETARALLAAQNEEYAIVIGAEQLSHLLDMEDRSTAVLFGDGAAAAVIRRKEGSIYASMLGAKGGKEIYGAGPGTGIPPYIHMDGRAVFRFATSAIPKCIQGILEASNKTLEEVDWVICHQANARIIEHCIKKLHAPKEKFFMNMEHFGNTSSASIPLAISEMEEQGLLKEGQKLLLVGFGSGLTWGGCILEYHGRKL